MVPEIKRNIDRFPADFCFALSAEEMENLRYQFGASSVLHSKRAVQVNIEIMRAFVRLREILGTQSKVSNFEEMNRTKRWCRVLARHVSPLGGPVRRVPLSESRQ